MKRLLMLILLYCSACTAAPKPNNNNSKPVSHVLWNQLLHEHVSAKGIVDYKGMIKDSVKLNMYLKLLSDNPPQQSWTQDEQKAYWINAYNAFTVKLITKYYPVKSIKDIGSSIQIPFVNTPWEIKFFKIGGKTFNLDKIEHGILLKQFNDPRIHFAIVCASASCPQLRNEAYDATKLNQQLDSQATRFINDPTRNKITPDKIEISKIFLWYKGYFTHNGSLIDYLNKYSKVKIHPDATISHLDYNWSLNGE